MTFILKSKIKSDLFIMNTIKRNSEINLSYTILRVSNVYGMKKI